MESNNLTTRTYTAPSCNLIVDTKGKQLSQLNLRDRANIPKFILHLDHPDRGAAERVTLEGYFHQLDNLQRVTSKYIADLVAKFPLPTTNETPEPEQAAPASIVEPQEASVVDRLFPDPDEPISNSGLLRNLPGLRDRSSQPAPANPPEIRPNPLSARGISKFLGRWHQDDRQSSTPRTSQPPTDPAPINPAFQSPYFVGGERPLDHQFHLGELSTTASGAAIVLSAIQLFDLATVLDEYAAERQSPAQKELKDLDPERDRQANLDRNATPLSRLPNLHQASANTTPQPIYHQNRRSRPAAIAALPWALAAATIVGAPLLFFNANPNNSLLESISKGKLPNFGGGKERVASKPSGTQPDKSSTEPTVDLPKPWQSQPVQPPKNNVKPADIAKPVGSGIELPKDAGKIGITSLPQTIIGKGGAGVAPNPLNLDPLASGVDSPPTKTPTVPVATPKPKDPDAKAKPPASKTPAKNAAVAKAKPTPPANTPGQISISKQPLSIPRDLPTGTSTSPLGQSFPVPVPGAVERNNPGKIDPLDRKKGKPAPNGANSIVNGQTPFLTPSNTIEPKSVKLNPNLITTPAAAPNAAGNETPIPQVIPEQPLQSNAGRDDSFENSPSLQEAKRYFQGKWKATPTQPSPLQYVLEVSGKSGLVRSVNPQGEAATTYLKQTKLIKAGQKLVSPVAGSSDQKIRVLLQPNGNVDTFVEP